MEPVVCPAVEGYIREKSMEVRFFAPGGVWQTLTSWKVFLEMGEIHF